MVSERSIDQSPKALNFEMFTISSVTQNYYEKRFSEKLDCEHPVSGGGRKSEVRVAVWREARGPAILTVKRLWWRERERCQGSVFF